MEMDEEKDSHQDEAKARAFPTLLPAQVWVLGILGEDGVETSPAVVKIKSNKPNRKQSAPKQHLAFCL